MLFRVLAVAQGSTLQMNSLALRAHSHLRIQRNAQFAPLDMNVPIRIQIQCKYKNFYESGGNDLPIAWVGHAFYKQFLHFRHLFFSLLDQGHLARTVLTHSVP